MNSREDVNYSGFSRRSVVLAALGLALVAGALAVFFCFFNEFYCVMYNIFF